VWAKHVATHTPPLYHYRCFRSLQQEREHGGAKHAAGAFSGAISKKRRFITEHGLTHQIGSTLSLFQTYAIPAALYGSQIWSTGMLDPGDALSSVVQKRHRRYLSSLVGARSAAWGWAVLSRTRTCLIPTVGVLSSAAAAAVHTLQPSYVKQIDSREELVLCRRQTNVDVRAPDLKHRQMVYAKYFARNYMFFCPAQLFFN
jgi:hypothetical protein